MLKRKQSGNAFHSQFKQSNAFNLFGFRLPRVFVLVMCILVVILTVLIIELSYDASTLNEQEQQSQIQRQPQTSPISNKNANANDESKLALANNAYMKNKVSIDSAPRNVIPVLIFCHARAQYLKRTLSSVFKYLHTAPWNERFVLFISQDGNNRGISQIIQKLASEQQAYWLQFDYAQTSRAMMKGFEQESWRVYHKISAHYKWALNKLLIELDYQKLVILEEDMQISPDFFSYFYHLAPLLDADESIYCISAWNDYGQQGLVQDSKALYRTDVFPGLGWMLTQKLWTEFRLNFSLAFWDDWFREPKQTKHRSCIRPEVSRTYTFGEIGSSGGWFYVEYLAKMQLNTEEIDWSEQDVQYLLNTNYDAYLQAIIEKAEVIEQKQLSPSGIRRVQNRDCVIYYEELEDYSRMASILRLLNDHKFGLPRQSYRGIVIVTWNGHRILFVPKRMDWTPRDQYKLIAEPQSEQTPPKRHGDVDNDAMDGREERKKVVVHQEPSPYSVKATLIGLWNYLMGPLSFVIDVQM